MIGLQRASRWGSLIRYHRPQQFVWRLYRLLQRKFQAFLPSSWVFRPGTETIGWRAGGAEAFARLARHRVGLWPLKSQHVMEIAHGRFGFLGETRKLCGAGFDDLHWNVEAPRLWRFHLHCQEYLLDLAQAGTGDCAWQLVDSWLRQNQHSGPLGDPDAWHPFCISRRLPVWLGLAALHPMPPQLETRFWDSVRDQVLWLRRRCEWDLGGNHLIENLTALYLAECFLDGWQPSRQPEAAERLVAELGEQILASGEHLERTPTYHALMLVCVLECLEASRFVQEERVDFLQRCAAKMLGMTEWLKMPDGRLPLLGDSVREESPDLDQLRRWADTLEVTVDSDSVDNDYWDAFAGDGSRLLFDVGPLACDHLPAHGHADLLQITASFGGMPGIVDTGTYQYEAGDRRLRSRQTAAHNVLQLGAQEQCDVWSSFRMGRRGHVIWSQRGEHAGTRWCAAAHDGFHVPVGRLVWAVGDEWAVIDWWDSRHTTEQPVTRLHWHPGWQLDETLEHQVWRARHRDVTGVTWVQGLPQAISAKMRETEYYCGFGQRERNLCLDFYLGNSRASWIGYVLSFHESYDADSMQKRWLQRLQCADGRLTLQLQGHILAQFHVRHGLLQNGPY